MHVSHINCVIVFNIILREESCQYPLNLHPMCLLCRSKIRCISPWSSGGGLGLGCYPLKELRFQKLTPYPDYHTSSLLSCKPLVLLMVRRLISMGSCFPSPPDSPFFLNYDWNGIFKTLTIHSNLFWLLMITSDNFVDTPPLPPHLLPSFLISYAE